MIVFLHLTESRNIMYKIGAEMHGHICNRRQKEKKNVCREQKIGLDG